VAARNNQLVYVGLFMAAMGLVLGFDAWAWLMSGSTHDASYAGPAAGPAAVFTQKVRVAAALVLVAAGLLIAAAAARRGKRLD
jgi:hypothetical protein